MQSSFLAAYLDTENLLRVLCGFVAAGKRVPDLAVCKMQLFQVPAVDEIIVCSLLELVILVLPGLSYSQSRREMTGAVPELERWSKTWKSRHIPFLKSSPSHPHAPITKTDGLVCLTEPSKNLSFLPPN